MLKIRIKFLNVYEFLMNSSKSSRNLLRSLPGEADIRIYISLHYFFLNVPFCIILFFFFFRIHSALCLDPQAGGKVCEKEGTLLSGCLMGFCLPSSSWRALSALPPSSSSSLAQPPEDFQLSHPWRVRRVVFESRFDHWGCRR